MNGEITKAGAKLDQIRAAYKRLGEFIGDLGLVRDGIATTDVLAGIAGCGAAIDTLAKQAFDLIDEERNATEVIA